MERILKAVKTPESIHDDRRATLREDPARAAGESVLVRLAVRLYALRTSKGLTQEELAALSGVDQANISDIENGDANPTAKTIGRLAAGLDVNAGSLFDHTSIGVQFGSNLNLRDGVAWGRSTAGGVTIKASSGVGRSWPRLAASKVKRVKVEAVERRKKVGAV